MKSYWKIPKSWIQEKGLSATEALVLADIEEWIECSSQACTYERCANHCGMGRTTVYDIVKSLQKKGFDVQFPNKFVRILFGFRTKIARNLFIIRTKLILVQKKIRAKFVGFRTKGFICCEALK